MSELKTCFKRVDYDLAGLLHYIDIGDIGLPDIQRPFVWSNAKVRDLFDSMYRGFPVGYLLFWENAQPNGAKQIGVGGKAARGAVAADRRRPAAADVAVRRVSRQEGARRGLQRAADRDRVPAARREVRGGRCGDPQGPGVDPEHLRAVGVGQVELPDGQGLPHRPQGRRSALTEEEEEQISHNLDRLFDLQKYPFTALEIASTGR